jgi:hypothetical protein
MGLLNLTSYRVKFWGNSSNICHSLINLLKYLLETNLEEYTFLTLSCDECGNIDIF